MSDIIPTEAELAAEKEIISWLMESNMVMLDPETLAVTIATHTRYEGKTAEETNRQWVALVHAAEREFPDLDTATTAPSNTLLVDTVRRWVQMYQSVTEKLSGCESIIALMTEQMNWQKHLELMEADNARLRAVVDYVQRLADDALHPVDAGLVELLSKVEGGDTSRIGCGSPPSAGSVLCVVKITGPSLNIEMRIDSQRANLLMRAALDVALAEANINYREQTPNAQAHLRVDEGKL
jgi:hypothetical protein